MTSLSEGSSHVDIHLHQLCMKKLPPSPLMSHQPRLVSGLMNESSTSCSTADVKVHRCHRPNWLASTASSLHMCHFASSSQSCSPRYPSCKSPALISQSRPGSGGRLSLRQFIQLTRESSPAHHLELRLLLNSLLITNWETLLITNAAPDDKCMKCRYHGLWCWQLQGAVNSALDSNVKCLYRSSGSSAYVKSCWNTD